MCNIGIGAESPKQGLQIFKYDTCVLCEKETEYLVSEHIDNRLYYIVGAGQLCKKCYTNIGG